MVQLVVLSKRSKAIIIAVAKVTFISFFGNQILHRNFFHAVPPNPWQHSQILHSGFADRGVATVLPAFFYAAC